MTDDVDALFDLPAGDFVAARNAFVNTAKADGRTEEAAAVKALKRPTLAAWAVNQVVRADGDAYEALVAAGRTMQKAQRRALSGVRDTGLRDASTARRGLVEALTDHAARVLADAGARPDSHLDDVAATFEAASADPDAAATIGAGRLSAPLRVTTNFSGTSALLAMSLAASDDADEEDDGDEVDPAAAERRREAIRALEAARSRADGAAVAAREARDEAETAAGRALEARRVATEARATADRAEIEADDLDTQAQEATATAAVAATTVQDEAAAVEAARAALDDLS